MNICIVGGGLAGLTAAAYAVKAGHQVHVLEKSHQLGGRARTQNNEGYLFNMGPHALYKGSVGLPILRELGVTFSGGNPPVRGYVVHGGKRIPFTRPFGLGLLRPSSLLALTRLGFRLMRGDPHEYAGMTLAQFLQDAPTPVRELMEMYFRVVTYTHAPDMLGMDAAMDQSQAYFRGNVLYMDGGWQRMVDQLYAIAERAGAVIETGVRVDRIDDTTLTLADGRVIAADAVILAVEPDVVCSLIPDAHLPKMIPVRESVLDVALSSLPNPNGLVSFGMDTPYYLSVHSASAALAPRGGAVIHVAKYLAPGEAAAKREDLEHFLEIAQPGWRAHVVNARYLPDMTVSHSIVTGFADRPAVQLRERVFLAGDWVGDEGQLADAALASARKASQLASRLPARAAEREMAYV